MGVLDSENCKFVLTGLIGLPILFLGVYFEIFTPRALVILPIFGFLLFVIAQWFKKRFGFKFDYYGRMAFHSLGGIFFVVFGLFFSKEASIIVVTSVFFIFLINLVLERKGIKTTFYSGYKINSIKKSHYFSGTFFLLSSLLVLLLFNINIAYASILVLSFGDPAAALVGSHFGRIKNPLNKNKTIEGSLAFFLCSFAGASLFVSPIFSFFGALICTIVEALSTMVDDNLVIPPLSAVIIYLLMAIII